MNLRDQILNAQPAWVEHQDRLAQARDALRRLQAQADAEHVQRVDAEREHRAAVLAAAEDGSQVPPDLPPQSQGLAVAQTHAQAKVMSLVSEGRSVRAEIAPQVEARAREEHDRIVWDARDLVERLTAAAKDMSDLLKVVTEARAAVEAQGPRRSDAPSSRTRPLVSAADLVEDVQRGICTLDPEPLRGGLPTGVVVDRGPSPHEGSRTPSPVPVPARGRAD